MTCVFAGLDVSQASASICVVDAEGEPLLEAVAPSDPAAIADVLKPYRRILAKVGTRPASSRPTCIANCCAGACPPMSRRAPDPRRLSGAAQTLGFEAFDMRRACKAARERNGDITRIIAVGLVAQLFQLEAPRLRRFLRRFGHSISPEDIVQDSFTVLAATRPGSAPSPRAYLFRVARNLAIDEVRRRKVSPIDARANPAALDPPSAAPSRKTASSLPTSTPSSRPRLRRFQNASVLR